MNVTANQVFPVETDLPDEWLGLLGCGITTGLGRVFNVAKVAGGVERRGRRPRPSRSVDGAGGEARAARARSSPSTRSRSGARSPGRSARRDLVDPAAEDSIEAVRRLTGGRGADYVLEAATLASRPDRRRS